MWLMFEWRVQGFNQIDEFIQEENTAGGGGGGWSLTGTVN